MTIGTEVKLVTLNLLCKGDNAKAGIFLFKNENSKYKVNDHIKIMVEDDIFKSVI